MNNDYVVEQMLKQTLRNQRAIMMHLILTSSRIKADREDMELNLKRMNQMFELGS